VAENAEGARAVGIEEAGLENEAEYTLEEEEEEEEEAQPWVDEDDEELKADGAMAQAP